MMNRTPKSRIVRGAMLACLLPLTTGCSMLGGQQWTVLTNGTSLAGWKGFDSPNTGAWMTASKVALDPAADGTKFLITPGQGILVNGPKGSTCDLVSDQEFGDCEFHIEFNVAKDSNSGVYLQGKYEIQILDSFGKAQPTYSDCGAIYPRWINDKNTEGHAPLVNASKAPGQWQSFDIVFKAPRFDAEGKRIAKATFVKVLQNGVLIHQNVELNGVTRGAIGGHQAPEVAMGPLRLQGDHGPVAFRNIRIRAVKLQ
jgi:hypothetical protein